MVKYISNKTKGTATWHIFGEKLITAMAYGVADDHMCKENENDPAIGRHECHPDRYNGSVDECLNR